MGNMPGYPDPPWTKVEFILCAHFVGYFLLALFLPVECRKIKPHETLHASLRQTCQKYQASIQP